MQSRAGGEVKGSAGMDLRQIESGKAKILYDADRLDQPPASCFFEPAWWAERGALLGTARGRGAAVMVRAGALELVLRHYRRGGLAARFSEDRYLWIGPERSRPFREFRLTAELYARGLPVPRPVAAQLVRDGLHYRGDLATERLAETQSLAERLVAGALPASLWAEVGRCLRRFHDAGLDHADLNAHNLLLDSGGTVYLIDFDRGRLRRPGRWAERNLARLHRSLEKLLRLEGAVFSGRDWRALRRGYGKSG